ncbi:MFS transporter [Staphylococcus cornubiensis]|uniref:MFS transporter n=1 Tax=Staphylococcus cornubiensis TaxID=1986155 RepID=UPI000A371B04|nr:MFS transporter [Staphylococcus cornubiensis]
MQKSIILLCFETISTFFSAIFTFACGFYILTITDSGSIFGSYLAVLSIITILTSPLLGNLIDRHSNKKILLFGQLLSSMSLFIFACLHHNDIYSIFTVMIILVFVDAMVKTTISSNFKFVTGPYLEKMVSIRQTIQAASLLITPILGGVIVAIIKINTLAFINVATELIGLILLLFLTFKNPTVHHKAKSFSKGLLEGMTYLFHHHPLKVIIITSLCMNFLCNALIVGFPIVIVNQLHYSSKLLGMAEGVLGGAIVLSSLIIAMFKINSHIKNLYVISMILQALSLLIVASTYFLLTNPMLVYSLILLSNFLLGCSVSLNNIPFQMMMHHTIEENFKSRVFSLTQSIVSGLTPLSYVLFGLLVPLHYGIVYVVCSIIAFIVVLFFRKSYIHE